MSNKTQNIIFMLMKWTFLIWHHVFVFVWLIRVQKSRKLYLPVYDYHNYKIKRNVFIFQMIIIFCRKLLNNPSIDIDFYHYNTLIYDSIPEIADILYTCTNIWIIQCPTYMYLSRIMYISRQRSTHVLRLLTQPSLSYLT